MTLALELGAVAALILLNASFVAGEYRLATSRWKRICESNAGQPARTGRVTHHRRPGAVHYRNAAWNHDCFAGAPEPPKGRAVRGRPIGEAPPAPKDVGVLYA
jgi:hypothetical protein